MDNEYFFGSGIAAWRDGNAQNITLIITEDCNLRCKYCYITKKRSNKTMSLEIAKSAIDFILSEDIRQSDALVLEFIGGEPLLEINLIQEVTEYFIQKSYELDHPWFWNYRISICTNGMNYLNDTVQAFLQKHKSKISISITLDGTEEKHDLQRVTTDGSGSYKKILPAIPVWLKDFYPSTKVTFSSDDLKFLKSSIIELWNLGVKDVAANVVFEDVWKDNDDILFEAQLIQLADYVLDNKLYQKFNCTFFDDQLGGFSTAEELDRTNCGAGKMLAIGPNGDLYPCIRYKDFSLNEKEEWIFGNILTGINMEHVRPFMVSSNRYISDEECINCEVGAGCSYCQGLNYDDAETNTNYHRAKYICKMHKARVRANNYYFARLENEHKLVSKKSNRYQRTMYFLLSNNFIDFCHYKNSNKKTRIPMDESIVFKGLEYCHKNFYKAIFVHDQFSFNSLQLNDFTKYKITHILPINFYEKAAILQRKIFTVCSKNINYPFSSIESIILNIDAFDIDSLYNYVNILMDRVQRININIQSLDADFDFSEYLKQLIRIKDKILNSSTRKYDNLQINVLTDLNSNNKENQSFMNCGAGHSSFTLAPNGNFYICPAFYSTNSQEKVGSLDLSKIDIKNKRLYDINYHPLCNSGCKSYQCINCVYLNKKATKEVNVSPSFQCKKSTIESFVSKQLYKGIRNSANENIRITSIPLLDPIEIILNDENAQGFYKF